MDGVCVSFILTTAVYDKISELAKRAGHKIAPAETL